MTDMTIKTNDEFSFTIELKREDKKVWSNILMMPRYATTEWMFPKKKKRGTMRRMAKNEV